MSLSHVDALEVSTAPSYYVTKVSNSLYRSVLQTLMQELMSDSKTDNRIKNLLQKLAEQNLKLGKQMHEVKQENSRLQT